MKIKSRFPDSYGNKLAIDVEFGAVTVVYNPNSDNVFIFFERCGFGSELEGCRLEGCCYDEVTSRIEKPRCAKTIDRAFSECLQAGYSIFSYPVPTDKIAKMIKEVTANVVIGFVSWESWINRVLSHDGDFPKFNDNSRQREIARLWDTCKDECTLSEFVEDLGDRLDFNIHNMHDLEILWEVCHDTYSLEEFVEELDASVIAKEMFRPPSFR